MNHDSLHDLWHSAANQPDAATTRRVAEQFAARWQRQRRWQLLWLTWTFLALSAASALALAQLGRGAVDLARQAMLLPLLGAPWLAAIHFLRTYLRDGAAVPDAGQPFVEVLATARHANATERRRLRVIGALLAAMLPISALAVWQLQVAGKASAREAWSMGAVFAGSLAVGAAVVAWRYWSKVEPERRLLDTRLSEVSALSSP